MNKYKHLTSLTHLRNGDKIMNFPDFLVSISEKDRQKEINDCPAAEPKPIWFFHLTSFFSLVPDNHHESPNRAKYDYRFPLSKKTVLFLSSSSPTSQTLPQTTQP
jgi:hypothetical protein